MDGKKSKILPLALVLLALVVALAGLYYYAAPKGTTGTKTITVEIIVLGETLHNVELTTEAAFLGEALQEADLIQGQESPLGLFVTSVSGIEADDSLQQWWRITQDGAMAATSVDATPLQDGDHFELTLMEGYE